MIGRRTFLVGTSAVAIAPLLPALPVADPANLVAELPKTTIWVGGHYGEYDWHPFHGESKRDVIRQLFNYHGHGNDDEIDATMTMTDEELDAELKAMEMDVARAEVMDGLQVEEIKPHHWIRAGLGCLCSRCDCECCADNGARAIGVEAVCEECLTLADRLELGDHDEVEEELIEMMMDHECEEDEVREVLARSIDPALIPTAMWEKCIATARVEL